MRFLNGVSYTLFPPLGEGGERPLAVLSKQRFEISGSQTMPMTNVAFTPVTSPRRGVFVAAAGKGVRFRECFLSVSAIRRTAGR